jgi:hypothetical protein
MDKPNQPYSGVPPTAPTSVQSPMPMWLPDPSIKGVSFDQLLNQRGIRMIHHKAIPCMNVKSTDFQAHRPDCEFCDDSGILYYESKEIWGVFSGNSIEKTFEAHGIWEVGTAVVTLPTEYPDGTQADFNTYDRLEIPDFTVRLWEHKGYEPRPGGIQDLRYPVEKVEYASSITDNVQKFYVEGVDFTLTPDNIDSGGSIQWIPGKEPAYNVDLGRGEVIGWSYFAKPIYVVVQSLRELRITQEMVGGIKQARRLPQQILVKRDFMVGSGEKITDPVVP